MSSRIESELSDCETNIREAESYLDEAKSAVSRAYQEVEENTYAIEQWGELESEGYSEACDIIQHASVGARLAENGYEEPDEIVEAIERFSDLADVFADHPLTADIAEMCSDSNGVREVLDILSRRAEKSSSNAGDVVAAIQMLISALHTAGVLGSQGAVPAIATIGPSTPAFGEPPSGDGTQARTVSDPPSFDNGSSVGVTDEQDNNQPTAN
jgi:hypothetical protein